jgi:hypothetical protein
MWNPYPIWNPVTMEIVNNYFQTGPHSNSGWGTAIQVAGCGVGSADCTHVSNSAVYLSGNYHNLYRPNNTYAEDSFR